MVSSTTFELDISYSQIAIFQSSLSQPFNHWTKKHSAQGFAWRPGSVSFGTVLQDGAHQIELSVLTKLPSISAGALRAIEVPFDVPLNGAVEVASISDSMSLTLPFGKFQLRYELLPPAINDKYTVKIILVRTESAGFKVIRADGELIVEYPLLLTAVPAE
jgi:Competence protein J (ComJ)